MAHKNGTDIWNDTVRKISELFTGANFKTEWKKSCFRTHWIIKTHCLWNYSKFWSQKPVSSFPRSVQDMTALHIAPKYWDTIISNQIISFTVYKRTIWSHLFWILNGKKKFTHFYSLLSLLTAATVDQLSMLTPRFCLLFDAEILGKTSIIHLRSDQQINE